MNRWLRLPLALCLFLSATVFLLADDPKKDEARDKGPDLTGFRTVDEAVTTRVSRTITPNHNQPGYLGVQLDADVKDRLVVGHVESGSPAAKAGLEVGDVIRQVDGQIIGEVATFRDLIQSKQPGDALKMTVQRKDKNVDVSATLAAVSRPLGGSEARADLGVRTSESDEGAKIDRFPNGSAAEAAGLKVGDVIVRIDDVPLGAAQRLRDAVSSHKPGETVTLLVKREGKDLEIKVKLGGDEGDASRFGWDTRGGAIWRKDVYHLGIIVIDYPDVEHNAKVSAADWEKALFSKGTYTDKSVTGQSVYGSLNDYYLELSCDTFHVEGKAFEPIKVSKKRAEYGNETSNRDRLALLTEAMDKILERDGKEAFKDIDGLCFIYAGGRVQTNRGNLYWPHRASVSHQGKRWPYYICAEGGGRMGDISVFCHEFGHMLGLPDLYARPENPGSEGLGVWCAMSNQLGGGRPQHFSAWCKEQLGWLKPTVIDPTVKQKLILGPVEGSSKECYKVLIRPDGSEYLLLENRTKKGFDRDLPGEGLLVWRVVDNHPILEESHGILGPDGPDRFRNAVPFPSASNNAFTPYTTPSSKSQKGGGLPVHITNIEKLPDGRITFFIGYESL
jgi:M6 family metalloprotease-like protein